MQNKEESTEEPSFKFTVKKVNLREIKITFDEAGFIKSFCGTTFLGESHDLPVRWVTPCDNIKIALA